MSDYGRYGGETRNPSRDRDQRSEGYSRNSDSIFNYGEGRERSRGGNEGRWTQERENFSWNRDDDRDRDRDRDRDNRERGFAHWRESDSSRGQSRDRDEQRRNRGEQSRGREEQGFGRDDQRGGLPIDETSRLIASNKVEGTAVYGSDGERLGSIYNFMVDKASGRAEYAVMSYGGFLGMGQRYYPLPWKMLTYDTREGGYRINMTERDLRDAPSFDRQSEPRFDQRYSEHVHGYYGMNY